MKYKFGAGAVKYKLGLGPRARAWVGCRETQIPVLLQYNGEIITVKSLKSKKRKLALTLFYYVSQEIWLGNSKKLICIDQSRFYIFHTRENSKMFNITSKYFSFFNNKLPASWVAHITRDFLSCYSCSYYSSMVQLNSLSYSPFFSLRKNTKLKSKKIRNFQ